MLGAPERRAQPSGGAQGARKLLSIRICRRDASGLQIKRQLARLPRRDEGQHARHNRARAVINGHYGSGQATEHGPQRLVWQRRSRGTLDVAAAAAAVLVVFGRLLPPLELYSSQSVMRIVAAAQPHHQRHTNRIPHKLVESADEATMDR
ncbi:hypothetical protein S7711_10732 [Stachybotrys chartarum IBT 7711]|uniref:Uncharacterized protein n=1 Tax=Stachybotrys chartarum (strain CBS 109288 / IBT 7711) TaxID=1280523 RepID=A0A084B1P6_STACB|nr:hypothetical protein S7711_10732 [Stachybotrys chartarum IBT 7711]KFA51758.1 hypothetical protein S40293_10651 [Stachybotrys chartarum IBT 40293]KFA71988.1 hypothetical protein S40288_11125 [Stachybotrys chartarum IBT 40288]